MKHLKTFLIVFAVITLFVSGTVHAQDDEEYTIGIFLLSSQLESVVEPFIGELIELGYIEGDIEEIWTELLESRSFEQGNVTIIFPPAIDEDEESIPEVVQSLIDAGVDVIFTPFQADAAAIHPFNDEIPMVFGTSDDPVGVGLVEDLTEPGGNVTGITSRDYHGMRLQLLLEIDPSIERVYYPYNPDKTSSVSALEEIEAVAEAEGLEIVTYEFSDAAGVMQAIQNIPDDVDAIFMSADLENFSPQTMGAWIATSMRVKVGISLPAYAEVPGALMGYGPDLAKNGILAARQVDQILRGADPAVMPVQNSEYALMVNLMAAAVLEIDVPRSILRRANLIMRPGE